MDCGISIACVCVCAWEKVEDHSADFPPIRTAGGILADTRRFSLLDAFVVFLWDFRRNLTRSTESLASPWFLDIKWYNYILMIRFKRGSQTSDCRPIDFFFFLATLSFFFFHGESALWRRENISLFYCQFKIVLVLDLQPLDSILRILCCNAARRDRLKAKRQKKILTF